MSGDDSLQYIVSCRTANSGEAITSVDESVCVAAGSPPMKVHAIKAYASIQTALSAEGSVNHGDAAVLWTTGFSSVVGLYLLAAHVGAIISFIRRG